MRHVPYSVQIAGCPDINFNKVMREQLVVIYERSGLTLEFSAVKELKAGEFVGERRIVYSSSGRVLPMTNKLL